MFLALCYIKSVFFLLLPVSSLFLWWFFSFTSFYRRRVLPLLLLTCHFFLELLNLYFMLFIHRNNCFTKLCFVSLNAHQHVWSLFVSPLLQHFSWVHFYHWFCWSLPSTFSSWQFCTTYQFLFFPDFLLVFFQITHYWIGWIFLE